MKAEREKVSTHADAHDMNIGSQTRKTTFSFLLSPGRHDRKTPSNFCRLAKCLLQDLYNAVFFSTSKSPSSHLGPEVPSYFDGLGFPSGDRIRGLFREGIILHFRILKLKFKFCRLIRKFSSRSGFLTIKQGAENFGLCFCPLLLLLLLLRCLFR